MPLVTWSDKLAVGVKSVDEQHMVLFDAMNDLHAAMMKGQTKLMMAQLLRNLLTYTRNHFAAEEAMMMAAKYPSIAEHRAKHRALTSQVQGYAQRYERGDLTLSVQLLSFLRDWLTSHIQVEDRAYLPWFAERGIR